MSTTPSSSDITSKLATIIGMEGLLFVPHPNVDGWQTTRAVSPEIAAFRTEGITPAFGRLAIKHYFEGETDPDGYEFDNDTYIIEKHDRATYGGDVTKFDCVEEYYQDREEALERVAEIMQTVVDERA